METEKLRQLEAVARTGTVTGAANELHLSQPALSRSLANLERELGVELLVRRGKRVEISRAGNVVLEYARPMLHEERLMLQAIEEISGRSAGVMIGSIAPAPLRILVSDLLGTGIDLRLSTTSLPDMEVTEALMEGKVDLAIGLAGDRRPSFAAHPLITERLAVSLPAGHRLAGRSELSFAELDGQTFLLQAHIGFWRAMVERAMPKSTFLVQEMRDVYLELAKTSQVAVFVSMMGMRQLYGLRLMENGLGSVTHGDLLGAIEHYKKAYPILSNDGVFLFYYASALSMANEPEKSIEILHDSFPIISPLFDCSPSDGYGA